MNKSILIVDDDHTNLEIISSILEKDYNLNTVDSGNACLKYLKRNKPDLILLDVMLPDKLGTDVCVQIKNNPKFVDVIIILLSGIKVTKDDYIFGLEIGADDYLSKPFEARELIARIKSIIRFKDSIVKLRETTFEPFDRQSTEQTAKIHEQELIKNAYPNEFKSITKEYTVILNEAIQQRMFKNNENDSDLTKKITNKLGFLKAGARDIIDIHKEALKYMLNEDSAKRAFLIKEESRIVLLETMGYLLNFYRNKI